jgi:hypothetical protein
MGALGAWALGFFLAAGAGVAAFGWSTGCGHLPVGAASQEPPSVAHSAVALPPPPPREAPAVDAGATAANAVDAGPYTGPLLGAMVPQASIFATMEWNREKRIGYIRQGGKAPVDPTPRRASNCEAGWYRMLGGGYVCGKHGTLDLDNPQVKLGVTAPDLDDILPYRYAWNTTMGTPLYRSVPSRQEMLDHEASFRARSKRRARDGDSAPEAEVVAANDNPYGPPPDAGAALPPLAAAENTGSDRKPWWLGDFDAGKPEIRLSDLAEEGDGVVARRMMKGFYVAVDRSFNWNNRLWYKTTEGLVAPADRLALNSPPGLQGIELGSIDAKGGAGFILGTKALEYALVAEGSKLRAVPSEPVPRFTAVGLTGRVETVAGVAYRETIAGWWMKSTDGTITEPGPPPEGLTAGAKWIDVNLSRQTLVAFEGGRAIYASLVSSGKKAKDPDDKAHDHRTVEGTFHIREKHIAVTMDGDGPAPGDMPYSIEDVPYVMYFEGSFALHAAFWHRNFGHEQSHGCVNLAPLDAKRLFFWADPPLPTGWHGVFTAKDKPGTAVVIHG